MEVHVVSSTVIPQSLPPTETTKIPLTVFDMVIPNMHEAVLYAFMPPTPTNTTLKDGLMKALKLFPTLAGHLSENNDRRRPYVSVGGNGGGVLIVETNVALELLDILPLEPSPKLLQLHPQTDVAQHLLQIQFNRFSCGGLVIGITNHHRVADGKSMSSFFVTWAKLVRGLHIDSVDFISKIKAQMPRKHSTFEILAAHLWKKVTRARGLDLDTLTEMSVAVNGRSRLRPAVPSEYFGNMVLNTIPRARVKELNEGSVADVARLVHDAVGRIGNGYIRSLIDFWEINGGDELVSLADVEGPVLCPNLEIDSWLGLPFHEVDFGAEGSLCGFLPSWVPVKGLVILKPNVVGKGGVDAVVALFEDHARHFKQISHSLD
ncbi:tryptamine hydroxycinnamoyltransferase 1-like [Magnolia sinica]|uniref:tryptamine hydroxycinnamoyltransferase 1-like n=1 Tax=Magnolia sinica TaxID=86752 RepID=UPI0026582451|nr:tryptamine hydroxycinnamoyltransferase 1-like [Magnolia sinica]